MNNYTSNSDKDRSAKTEPKIEPVVSGTARIQKKSGVRKIADAFVAEDISTVKQYLWSEVALPAAKKVVSDIIAIGTDMISVGINMFLFGESGRMQKSNVTDKITWTRGGTPYDRIRAGTVTQKRASGIDYDNIVFDTLGDADSVLAAMRDIIVHYGAVSVYAFYDLARVPNDNFTMHRYGWTNLDVAHSVRVPDGYILKLPKAAPLD